ncbi:DNA primase [Paenibacillus sp. Leaf72]|uniref:DNA primase n=1 Tax=Paenibacillus sp. Leaf72 TaxID=1736234 RepID=UPI000A969C12|nr:DNA primase [Paenibacillus sp. Leaf72]
MGDSNEAMFLEWVEKSKTKIDIVEVIEEYLMLKQNGSSFVGICPFHDMGHGNSTGPSFEVSQLKQSFRCGVCHVEGDYFEFLLRFNRRLSESFTHADCVKLIIKNYIGNDIGHLLDPKSERYSQLEKMYKAHELMSKIYHYILTKTDTGKDALLYLTNRGITLEAIDEFMIGFAPDSYSYTTQVLLKRDYDLKLMVEAGLLIQHQTNASKIYDRFRGRIMFPIHNIAGRVIGFGGRSMSQEIQPKYLNSPESPIFYKGSNLYNLNRAAGQIVDGQPLVFFEGYMDVIAAWQAGCNVGCATLGTTFTEAQTRLVRSITTRGIICYDGDKPGQDATTKALSVLEQFEVDVKVAPLPKDIDPDEYVKMWGADSFHKHVLGKAMPAIDFHFKFLKNKLVANDPTNYKNYLESILVLIKRLNDQEKERYMSLFEQRFHISRAEFSVICK